MGGQGPSMSEAKQDNKGPYDSPPPTGKLRKTKENQGTKTKTENSRKTSGNQRKDKKAKENQRKPRETKQSQRPALFSKVNKGQY